MIKLLKCRSAKTSDQLHHRLEINFLSLSCFTIVHFWKASAYTFLQICKNIDLFGLWQNIKRFSGVNFCLCQNTLCSVIMIILINIGQSWPHCVTAQRPIKARCDTDLWPKTRPQRDTPTSKTKPLEIEIPFVLTFKYCLHVKFCSG